MKNAAKCSHQAPFVYAVRNKRLSIVPSKKKAMEAPAPAKGVTNKNLKTILIAVLVISIITIGAILMRKQTVQLEMSEDGTLATGEIKNHWKVPFKKAA